MALKLEKHLIANIGDTSSNDCLFHCSVGFQEGTLQIGLTLGIPINVFWIYPCH